MPANASLTITVKKRGEEREITTEKEGKRKGGKRVKLLA